MNEDLIQRIKNTLKEESYSMNATWLRDCIEYFTSENNSLTYKDILKFVKTQWQLSDLREINNDNGCLPKNLSQQKCVVLNGTYILQMDKMYDIGTSKYKQLNEVRKATSDNINVTEDHTSDPWEPKRKRMLMLYLTDGIQDISAIEYQRIASLNDTLLPGYKVMIIGPVKCRRGVILLEQGKFKEIGGEVESLSITNALENVLARALNCSENPDPYNDNGQQQQIQKNIPPVTNDPFEDDFDINLEEVTQIEKKSKEESSKQNSNRTSSMRTQANLTDKKKDKQQSSILSNNSHMRNVKNKQSDIIETLDMGDELLEMIDENQIIASTSHKLTNNADIEKGKQNLVKPFRVFPTESNDDNKEDIVIVEDNDNTLKQHLAKTGKESVTNYSNMYFPEDDFVFDNIDECLIEQNKNKRLKDKECGKQANLKTNQSPLFQSHSTSKPFQHKTNTSTISSNRQQVDCKKETGNKRSALSPPSTSSSKMRCMEEKSDQKRAVRKISDFIKKKDTQEDIPEKICDFICDLLKETVKEVMYRTVRGQFITFGKLSKKNYCWQLEGTVTDTTAAIDVAIASEIIERFLGFSVQEFSQKKKLAKVNAGLEHELRMACRNAEQKLKRLDALLELELKPDEKAKVVNITSLTEQQREIIDKRLQALKI